MQDRVQNEEISMTRKLIALTFLASLISFPITTFAQDALDPEALLSQRNQNDGNPNDNKAELVTEKDGTGKITKDERCCLRQIADSNDYKGGIVDFALGNLDKCPTARPSQFTLRSKDSGNRVCPLSVHKS